MTHRTTSRTPLSSHRGFTLIELLVSVAIFSIVMSVGVGALLAMVSANKKAEATKSVMNNLNGAVEEMSRTIRVGSVYHCGGGAVTVVADCPSGDTELAFLPAGGDKNQSNNRTIYRFNATNHSIERSLNSGVTWVGLTAPEVTIQNLKLYVVGTATQRIGGDTNQARVVLVVQGVAGNGTALQESFNIETMVSQRILDI